MSNLLVTDPKGIVVGSWTRGKVMSLKRGDVIERNDMGACKFAGEMLNMPLQLQTVLLTKQRVVAE